MTHESRPVMTRSNLSNSTSVQPHKKATYFNGCIEKRDLPTMEPSRGPVSPGGLNFPLLFETEDLFAYHPFDDFFLFQTRKDWSTSIYVLIGESKALVIDAGTTMTNLTASIRRVTDKPFELALTHGHIDHTGAIHEFDHLYMHEADRYMIPDYMGRIVPIKEGFKFDLGNRTIEVIELPGHSYGSVAFLDTENKMLITGDAIGSKHCWVFISGLPLEGLKLNLQKLESIKEKWTQIWPGHIQQMGRVLKHDYVEKLAILTDQLLDGSYRGGKKIDIKTRDAMRLDFDPILVFWEDVRIMYNPARMRYDGSEGKDMYPTFLGERPRNEVVATISIA
jgi:glyoxylase-like metal-dependent hydrolase (beta-lactamase superfamily II)